MAITINGNGTLSGVTAGLTSSSMPTGSVLQVVQTHVDSDISSTGNDWDDLSGMTVAITPSASSSKILFQTSVDWAGNTSAKLKFLVDIGGAGYNDLPLPSQDGNRIPAHLTHNCYNNESDKGPRSYVYLHSPNTTSAVTYKTQMWGSGRINWPGNNGNSSGYGQGTSTLTAWEIAG